MTDPRVQRMRRAGLRHSLLMALFSLSCLASAGTWTVKSPDGRLAVTVYDHPALVLGAELNGRVLLPPAPLGITLKNTGAFPGGMRFAGMSETEIDETYAMPVGKRSVCRNHAREMRLKFTGGAETGVHLIVRAYDTGVAYRYEIQGRGDDTVMEEASSFCLPPASKAWLAPYSAAYEQFYTAHTNWTEFKGSIQVPMLFRTPSNQWVLITEAAVDGTFGGSGLFVADATTGRVRFRAGWRQTSSLPWLTPWRVAMVGDSLKPLVESTLVNDLAPASTLADTGWIKAGAAIFPWLTGPTSNNMSAARMKQFVDLAAAQGWGWIEFDNALVLGNQYGDPPEKWMACAWIPEVVAYADRRGVSVYGWDHWKNLDTPAKRERILGWMVDKGFKGIKVDFLESDTQARHQFRGEIARACAERRLMFSLHGDVTPRGLQRTWPNLATCEGVRGEEHYSPANGGANGPTPEYNATLVFTRNIPGSMDYTPTTFNLPGKGKGQRRTSNAHEMALAVVFESGWQGLGIDPESAQGPAAAALGFLKQLPAAWDDTRFVDGAPDEFAVIARRKGADWWIAGINASQPRTLSLAFDFLPAGSCVAELYTDAPQTVPLTPPLQTRVDAGAISIVAGRPFVIKLPANGGFGLKIKAPAGARSAEASGEGTSR